MVTGDSGLTAEAIARRIGLVDGERARRSRAPSSTPSTTTRCAAGSRERDVDLRPHRRPSRSCASPACCATAGEIVAMTGDGVNDAPALKRGRHRHRDGPQRHRRRARGRRHGPPRRQLRLDRRGRRGRTRGLRQHPPLRRLPLLLQRRRARSRSSSGASPAARSRCRWSSCRCSRSTSAPTCCRRSRSAPSAPSRGRWSARRGRGPSGCSTGAVARPRVRVRRAARGPRRDGELLLRLLARRLAAVGGAGRPRRRSTSRRRR